MLDLDPGARRLGELGLGLNPGINRFTGSILYDEKIGGTVHLALGQSYPETGGRQRIGPPLGPDRRHPPRRTDHRRRAGRDGRWKLESWMTKHDPQIDKYKNNNQNIIADDGGDAKRERAKIERELLGF